jgi:hypothetical protein
VTVKPSDGRDAPVATVTVSTSVTVLGLFVEPGGQVTEPEANVAVTPAGTLLTTRVTGVLASISLVTV